MATRTDHDYHRIVALDDRDDRRVITAMPSNGSAIAALVTGMLATSFAFLVVAAPAAVLLGIAAIALGIVGVRNANDLGGFNKGIAVTGIVTGVLGLLLGAAVLLGGYVALSDPAVQQELRDAVDAMG